MTKLHLKSEKVSAVSSEQQTVAVKSLPVCRQPSATFQKSQRSKKNEKKDKIGFCKKDRRICCVHTFYFLYFIQINYWYW